MGRILLEQKPIAVLDYKFASMRRPMCPKSYYWTAAMAVCTRYYLGVLVVLSPGSAPRQCIVRAVPLQYWVWGLKSAIWGADLGIPTNDRIQCKSSTCWSKKVISIRRSMNLWQNGGYKAEMSHRSFSKISPEQFFCYMCLGSSHAFCSCSFASSLNVSWKREGHQSYKTCLLRCHLPGALLGSTW